MTRKQLIIEILDKTDKPMSCAEITADVIRAQHPKFKGNIERYLSASVSSILAKLVKVGALKYSEEKGPRGGNKYMKV